MKTKKRLIVAFFAAIISIFAILTVPADAANTIPLTSLKLTRTLSLGSTGEDVRSLQKFLNNNGYFVSTSGAGSIGNETTVFDVATKNALVKFQAANGLSESGYVGNLTIALLAGWKAGSVPSSPKAEIIAMIQSIQSQIAQLQKQLEEILAGDNGTTVAPYISAFVVANKGHSKLIDTDDTVTITFSEAIKPESINSALTAGGSVSGILSSMNGGVTISSYGTVEITNIASFDAGIVGTSGKFTTKLMLDKTGKILTIVLESGRDIDIEKENFGSVSQIGGQVKNLAGGAMESKNLAILASGTFGGGINDGDSDETDNPYIDSIIVYNEGDKGVIDTGDMIKIYFNENIKPETINQFLIAGGSIDNVVSTETGGLAVAAGGLVTIKNIATFDMGTVANAGTFIVKIALNSTTRILAITITEGADIQINKEEFSSAKQIGGIIEDEDSQTMKKNAVIEKLTGSFGGEFLH